MGDDALARMERVAEAIGRSAADTYPRLWEADAVPGPLWAEMATAGLFGLTAPEAHGGAGLSVDSVGRIHRRFAAASGLKGLGTVWSSHNLIADWILGRFANAAQQDRWWPSVARGDATIAFAVSEPGAGAHPKRLSATATPVEGGWALNGAKAYVTNGPIAAAFAIVAVVDTDGGGRKRFAAFLVPADAEGLTIRPSEHVAYLKPSGHASLGLKNLFVSADARLSDLDDVYPAMVKPLRDHEDAPGAWSRLGASERLAAALARAGAPAAAGAAAARLRAAELLLNADPTAEGLLAVRAVLADAHREIADAVAERPDALSEADAVLLRDLDKLRDVARYAVDARFEAFGRRFADCA